MSEVFSVHPDELPHYLYEMARKALSVADQVETPIVVLDLVAALPHPELKLSELGVAQRAVIAKFLVAMIPGIDLTQYQDLPAV